MQGHRSMQGQRMLQAVEGKQVEVPLGIQGQKLEEGPLLEEEHNSLPLLVGMELEQAGEGSDVSDLVLRMPGPGSTLEVLRRHMGLLRVCPVSAHGHRIIMDV